MIQTPPPNSTDREKRFEGSGILFLLNAALCGGISDEAKGGSVLENLQKVKSLVYLGQ